ncbi:hypothetical protein ACFSC4_14105 [Deinococcus malanensis]|uniref:hypothetical protein n=1 Tax=Deinococcus malanensis TaxID=1706855 RepID=UPI00363B655E
MSLASGALANTGTDTVTATGTVPAPTVSVVLMTDAATPADFGTGYALNQLNNSTFAYGSNFLIKLTYANVTTNVSLALSGSQANYLLAYRHTPSGGTLTSDVPFSTSVGTATASGTATDTYASGATTTAFNAFGTSTGATRFAIGAKSTTAAVTSLSTTITLTATAN